MATITEMQEFKAGRELEIMAAVDGEEGFGGAEVTADELHSETAKTFVRTRVLLRRLGTAILNEPVPQSLIDIVYKKRDV